MFLNEITYVFIYNQFLALLLQSRDALVEHNEHFDLASCLSQS